MQQRPSSEAKIVARLLEIVSTLYGNQGSLSCSQNPPLVPILSQMYPIHYLLTYFFKMNINFTLPSTRRSF
jgi:hypothetical protein